MAAPTILCFARQSRISTAATSNLGATATNAIFKDELPTAVYKELDRRGLNGVPILLSTTSELSLAGKPERHWIVATRDNVAWCQRCIMLRVREPSGWRERPVPVMAANCLYAPPEGELRAAYVLSLLRPTGGVLREAEDPRA